MARRTVAASLPVPAGTRPVPQIGPEEWRRLRAAAGSTSDAPAFTRMPLGIAGMDRIIDSGEPSRNGKGLPVNALHEIRVGPGLAAAAGAGFALALGRVLSGRTPRHAHTHGRERKWRPVFWIADRFVRSEYGRPYAPGLEAFGIGPGDLVHVETGSVRELLWAAGEIAAAGKAAAFALIEIHGHPGELDLATSRRLMLRSRENGLTLLLLRHSGFEEASAAMSRWCVAPSSSRPGMIAGTGISLPVHIPGRPALRITLEKCRGAGLAGSAGEFSSPSYNQCTVEWDSDEQRLVAIDEFSGGKHAAARQQDGTGREARSGWREALAFPQPAETCDRPARPDALGKWLAAERAP